MFMSQCYGFVERSLLASQSFARCLERPFLDFSIQENVDGAIFPLLCLCQDLRDRVGTTYVFGL